MTALIVIAAYLFIGLAWGIANVIRAQIIGGEPMPVALASFVVIATLIFWPVYGPVGWKAAEALRDD